MQAIRSRSIQLILAFTPLFYSCAMATEKVLLWPEIQGHILNDGKPVAGLDLTQSLYWNYEENSGLPERTLIVKTNSEGKFIFPKIWGEMNQTFTTRLLYQPGIVMEIDAGYQSKSYSIHVAGSSSHFNTSHAAEILECELSTAELFEGTLLVKCKRRSI